MNSYKKIAVGILSALLFVLFLNFILNLWVAVHLTKLLTQNTTSSYSVRYDKLDISLLTNSIAIDAVALVPKKNSAQLNATTKISATIKSITVSNIGLLGILFDKKVTANHLTISNPEITLLTNGKKNQNEKDEPLKTVNKTFVLSNFDLKKANIKVVDEKSKKVLLKVHNLTINLKNVALSNQTLSEKIPFSFQKYTLACDSLYYHPSEFYDLKTDAISCLDSDVKISDLKLIPLYSRKQFVSKLSTEKDLYTVSSKEIMLQSVHWGFKDSLFFFDTKAALLDKIAASIYRSKVPKDDLTKKQLYNKLLRDLKFNLKIDTLKIRNSFVIYEEEISFKKGPGKLYFDNFNLTANAIESGLKKSSLPDLNIKIKCLFMKTSPLNIDWTLNVMDKTDGFRIKGTIANFDFEKLNAFTKPYINVKTKGSFDKVVFDITGNDVSSKGKFAMEYDHLKVTVFKKKDRKKKNKILSAIGNLFVKNDTNDRLKSADVAVEKVPETSFYNFLWLNIAEGLRKILI